MALPALLPVRRGPKPIDPENRLEFRSVGLYPRQWRWLMLWRPFSEKPTEWLADFVGRGMVFWPGGPDAAPPSSGKPRKKQLPRKRKELAERLGMTVDELDYLAVVQFMERQERNV